MQLTAEEHAALFDVPFETTLTGSGISFATPSNMPIGDMLTRMTWTLLWEGAGLSSHDPVCVAAVERMGEDERDGLGLRLEQLMEIISADLSDDVVVSPYFVFEPRDFNINHLSLALMPADTHVTLNIDELIEAAQSTLPEPLRGASGAVVHLHGQISDTSTISTTVRQYTAGLDGGSRSALARALEGKRVLVIGYSGRDIDVLPMIGIHLPSHLVWVAYPGEELNEGVRRVLERAKSAGCRVTVVEATPVELLVRLVANGIPELADLITLAARSEPTRSASRRARLLFGATPREAELLAVARVLADIGLGAKAHEILGPLPFNDGRREMVRRKLRARFLSRTGRSRAALDELLKPPPIPVHRTLGPWLRGANEVAAALPQVGSHRLAAALDALLVLGGEIARGSADARRVAGLARVRRIKREVRRGRARIAERAVQRLLRRDPDLLALGYPSRVDGFTWSADAAKLRGQFSLARIWCTKALENSYYANLAQRAWAEWKRAELDLLETGDERAVLEQLRRAEALADRSGDGRARLWCAATRADAMTSDLDGALAQVDVAEGLLSDAHPEDRLFVLVVRAEILRRRSENADVDEVVAAARAAASDPALGPGGAASALIAVDLVEAMCLADAADVAGRLEVIASDAARLGIDAVVTWIRTLRGRVAPFPAWHVVM